MIDLKSLILAKKMFGGGGAESTPEQAKTVDLAMAQGNQVVTPDEGYLLSQVTVNKPETLIPENIAEGIDIGGVIGSLVASSGSSGGKLFCIFSSATNDGVTKRTISHTLGVVPDFVFIVGFTSSDIYYQFGWNMRSDLLSLGYAGHTMFINGESIASLSSQADITSSSKSIYATSTTITLNNIDPAGGYRVFAFSGLSV